MHRPHNDDLLTLGRLDKGQDKQKDFLHVLADELELPLNIVPAILPLSG